MRHPEAIVHHGTFGAAHIARWWLAVHGPDADRSPAGGEAR